jgi:hypothetical protein
LLQVPGKNGNLKFKAVTVFHGPKVDAGYINMQAYFDVAFAIRALLSGRLDDNWDVRQIEIDRSCRVNEVAQHKVGSRRGKSVLPVEQRHYRR